MSSGLVLEFSKMHGAGNDFIVIDNRFFRLSEVELSAVAAHFCPRRFGIGADGLLALDVAPSDDLHYEMRYFNADGTRGEMCGNGARCLAAFARDAGISQDPLHFISDGTRYRASLPKGSSGPVRIELPPSSSVSLSFASIAVDQGLDRAETIDLDFVMTGVPHAVCFSREVDRIPVERWGRTIRHHDKFAASSGTNVDFVEIVESEGVPILKMRTFERGVEAETTACGTGAVSTFVAAAASGRIKSDQAVVRMRGGDLRVGVIEADGRAGSTGDFSRGLYLEGPVAFVYRGTMTV